MDITTPSLGSLRDEPRASFMLGKRSIIDGETFPQPLLVVGLLLSSLSGISLNFLGKSRTHELKCSSASVSLVSTLGSQLVRAQRI